MILKDTYVFLKYSNRTLVSTLFNCHYNRFLIIQILTVCTIKYRLWPSFFPVSVINETVRKSKSSIKYSKKWDAVIMQNTMFTQMHDRRNLRWPPNKMSAKKKTFYS
jgi:hypothetical protein